VVGLEHRRAARLQHFTQQLATVGIVLDDQHGEIGKIGKVLPDVREAFREAHRLTVTRRHGNLVKFEWWWVGGINSTRRPLGVSNREWREGGRSPSCETAVRSGGAAGAVVTWRRSARYR